MNIFSYMESGPELNLGQAKKGDMDITIVLDYYRYQLSVIQF